MITLNVNGLHNPIKRSKTIAKMKREKLHVIFWQEIHLNSVEHEKLKQMGFMNYEFSYFIHLIGKGIEGIAIQISNSVNFRLSFLIKSHYVLMKGFLDQHKVTLIILIRGYIHIN